MSAGIAPRRQLRRGRHDRGCGAEGRLIQTAAEVKETVADTVEKAKDAAKDAADKVTRLVKK